MSTLHNILNVLKDSLETTSTRRLKKLVCMICASLMILSAVGMVSIGSLVKQNTSYNSQCVHITDACSASFEHQVIDVANDSESGPDPDKVVNCTASTYGIGDGLMGSGCSDGSRVTETSMGIAHKTLQLGTKIKLFFDGKSVEATVVDRGPFVKGREIDLQPAVAHALGFNGVGHLQYEILV